MIIKNKVIVFGENFNVTLGDIRSFGENGYYVIVLWCNAAHSRYTPRDSRYVNEYYECFSLEEGVELLKTRFMAEPGQQYLLSAGAESVVAYLNSRYEELKDHFVFFRGEDAASFNELMVKENQIEIASAVGLRIPQSQLVDLRGLDVSAFSPDIDFPIFVKASDSLDYDWKTRTKICNTIEELREFLNSLQCSTILLQEFIKKKAEYYVEGIAYDYGECAYIPIQGRYVRFPADAFGTWHYVERFNLGADFLQQLKEFLKRLRYTGVFEIEFLQTEDDTLYFLEINFRYTAFHHSIANMGVNLSMIWANYEIYGDKEMAEPEVVKEPWYIMNEFADFKYCMKKSPLNLLGWIRDVRKTDSFWIYDKTDKKPFWKHILQHIV